MRLNYKLFIAIQIFCVFCSSVWSIRIIDIDESNVFTGEMITDVGFKQHIPQYNQVRVVSYSIDQQRFDMLSYYLYPTLPETDLTSVVFPQSMTLNGEDIQGLESCTLECVPNKPHTKDDQEKDYSLKVKISDCVLADQTWLLLPVSYEVGLKAEDEHSYESSDFVLDETKYRTPRKLVRKKSTQYGKSEDLLKRLRQSNYSGASAAGKEFKGTIYKLASPKVLMSSITLTGRSAFERSPRANDEQGFIGELATDLTFFAYGFTKLRSKQNGDRDNGFDGVFVNNKKNPNIVYITESKFRSRAMSDIEFKKQIGSESCQVKIMNFQSEDMQELKDVLEKAIAKRSLIMVGQTFLADGHMKSAYLDVASDVGKDLSYEELRVALKKMQAGKTVAALATKLKVDKKTLGSFLNKPTQTSPTIAKAFASFINESESYAVRKQLFPEQVRDIPKEESAPDKDVVSIPSLLFLDASKILQRMLLPGGKGCSAGDKEIIERFLSYGNKKPETTNDQPDPNPEDEYKRDCKGNKRDADGNVLPE